MANGGVLQSVGSFILDLFGIRTITQNFIPVDDQPNIEVDPAFFNVIPDPANQRNILTGAGVSSSPVFGNITTNTLTFAPGYDSFAQSVRATYIDAAAHTLATIAVPASGNVQIDLRVNANLGMANGVPNINASRPGAWIVSVVAWRYGSGAVTIAILDNSLQSNFKPFLPPATTSSTGVLGIVASGGNVLVQANGFAVAEAWTSTHVYTEGDGLTTVGQFATANGNVYLCTSSGTASGSAPTGTGKGLGTGALFDYVCAGAFPPVQWTMGAPRIIIG